MQEFHVSVKLQIELGLRWNHLDCLHSQHDRERIHVFLIYLLMN